MRALINLKVVIGLIIGGWVHLMSAQSMSYNDWVESFKTDARKEGIRPDILEAVFKDSSPNPRVIELDRKQPETVETFKDYLNKRLSPKLALGKAKLRKHKKHLRQIQNKYNVPPNVIVALWGLETNFGRNTGGFCTVNSLATLAYDGRRRDFFKSELLEALKIIQNENIPLKKLQGSWAGALGQAQFMPSTYNNYAVDEDCDNIKDIWTSHLDVFASMANYLQSIGWKNEEPWGYEVTLPSHFDEALLSPTPDKQFIKKSTDEWKNMGITKANGKPLPSNALEGAIIKPDKEGKRAFIVYNNFFVIFKWNRSVNFALTVLLLSNELEK